jgi:hypothetical protein
MTPGERKVVEGPIFQRLLDKYGKHIAAAKGTSGFDREQLATIILDALAAQGADFCARDAAHCTLREVAKPLNQVIELLDTPRNWDTAISFLGEPDETPSGLERYLPAELLPFAPPSLAPLAVPPILLHPAELRFIVLLRDLRKISRGLSSLPRRKPGGQIKTKHLRALVERLATYWEEQTAQPFKQSWHRENGERKPSSHAAAFVHDVVEFVGDRYALRKLPKVTEAIVSERNARDEGRHIKKRGRKHPAARVSAD